MFSSQHSVDCLDYFRDLEACKIGTVHSHVHDLSNQAWSVNFQLQLTVKRHPAKGLYPVKFAGRGVQDHHGLVSTMYVAQCCQHQCVSFGQRL